MSVEEGFADIQWTPIFSDIFIFGYKVHHLQRFAQCLTLSIRQAYFHFNLMLSLCHIGVFPFYTDGLV